MDLLPACAVHTPQVRKVHGEVVCQKTDAPEASVKPWKNSLKWTSNGPGDTVQRRVRDRRYRGRTRASLKCGILSPSARVDAACSG